MGVKDRSSPCRSSSVSSAYYLECRKDAQCECSMCKASITATLDLLQPFKPSTKENQPWPPPFPCSSPAPSSLSKRRPLHVQNSPPPKTPLHHSRLTLKARLQLFTLLLLLPFPLLFGLPWVVSCFSEARFHHGSFVELAQGSLVRTRLVDRLDFIQRRISIVSRAPSVSNCTGYEDAAWRLAENGNLLHSRCVMYASSLERVSVWGYAAKTGGVLGRSLVDRSFTVLSGRIMEWQEGHIKYIVHPEGSSWTMRRWAASAIVLDGNTWILEYKRTALSAGFGDVRGLMHLVTSAFARVLNNIKIYIDTAFFVYMRGLDLVAYQALSSSARLPPT